MELSITLNHIQAGRHARSVRPLSQAVGMCREAGFRYVNYMSDLFCEDWESRAHLDRQLLDKAGIKVEQSHAPFNRYHEHTDEEFPELFHRAFVAASILGAENVVVHADEYRSKDHYDVKEITEFTYSYLAPEAEYCKAHGMKLAIENLFEDHTHHCVEIDGKSRFTTRIEEQIEIINRFHDSSVCGCWDFGHAACANGYDGMLDALKKIGPMIECTHVHDNNKNQDQHLMPFLGEIDWPAHMAYLKKIGYKGKLSFEFVYGNFPDDVMPLWLNTVHQVGEKLITMFND